MENIDVSHVERGTMGSAKRLHGIASVVVKKDTT